MKDGTFEKIYDIEIACKNSSRRTRIFGEKFIENNKDKCKMIYKNKEKDLKGYYKEFYNKDSIKFQIKFTCNIINIAICLRVVKI